MAKAFSDIAQRVSSHSSIRCSPCRHQWTIRGLDRNVVVCEIKARLTKPWHSKSIDFLCHLGFKILTNNKTTPHPSLPPPLYTTRLSLKMVFGTLHTAEGNARSTAIKIVAKANNLDLDIKNHEFPITDSEYLSKYNKLGKIPTFIGADGYTLSECIAIAIYRMFALPLTLPSHPTW